MTLASTLQSEIYTSLGGRTDAAIQTASLRGLNLGQLAAAFLYSPVELQSVVTQVIAISATSFSESVLTGGCVRLKRVYNQTSGYDVPIADSSQFAHWGLVTPLTGVTVKTLCRHGGLIYVRPVPSVACTLDLHYVKYPTILTGGGDSLSFAKYDETVLLIATEYCWAVLEESENAVLFSKLTDRLAPVISAGVIDISKLKEQINANNTR